MSTRWCKKEGCNATVDHDEKESGYCRKGHWNEEAFSWFRPKCECGVDKVLELNKNAFRIHSSWCAVYKWKNGQK